MSVKEERVSAHSAERRREFHLSIRSHSKKQTPVLNVGRRSRGRPVGSKNKPKFLGILARDNCTSVRSHTIKISDGVDIMEHLFKFCRRQRRAITILRGNGAVAKARFLLSNERITALYGAFEILSISGTILPPPKPESEARLAISLSIIDESVFGGSVMPPLIASGPVTLTVLSFENRAIEKISSMANDIIKREP